MFALSSVVSHTVGVLLTNAMHLSLPSFTGKYRADHARHLAGNRPNNCGSAGPEPDCWH